MPFGYNSKTDKQNNCCIQYISIVVLFEEKSANHVAMFSLPKAV